MINQVKTVVIAGCTGSMGQQTVQLIQNLPGFELVGGYAPHAIPQTSDYLVTNQLAELPQADIWIDFTVPSIVFQNIKYAITHGYHPVDGTSGLSTSEMHELQTLAATKELGGLIAPNFGLSAVLLIQFAKQAAKYFPEAEVVEMHHQDKQDAPSGTAIATAKAISASRTHANDYDEIETIPGARGGKVDGVPIHSIRLPGYVAHEQVLFGGPGEALTIRQDSFDRQSFMSGIRLACQKVTDLNTLVVGLENILD